MAGEKMINGRLQLKHDTAANWDLAAEKSNFTPKIAEPIVYDADETYDYIRFKIGNGVQNVKDLPFYAGSWKDLEDKPGELEALLLLAEMEIVTPVVDANNYVYLDETDKILII